MMNLPNVKVRVFGSYEVDVFVGAGIASRNAEVRAMNVNPQSASVSATRPNPQFRVPPFTVEAQFITLAETVDWGLSMLGVPELWKQTQGEGIRSAG
jgi:hypothetical protein